jgi:hypothetical protein
MFLDHSPDRPVRHLKWRLRLLSIGAAVAVVGIYLDSDLVVWIAMAFLLAGFLFRFLPGEDRSSRREDASEG